MNIFLDILDRGLTGQYCSEKEWNMRFFPSVINKALKKYELQNTCNSKIPINFDDELADRFWEAGLEVATEVGMLNTSTERIIKFTREEIITGLNRACGFWRAGWGRDAVDVVPRVPEDSRPPITVLGPIGDLLSEELFIPIHQSSAQNWSLDGISTGVLATVHGREIRTGTPYETLAGALDSRMLREALIRAGRPGMVLCGPDTEPSEYGAFGGWNTPNGVEISQIGAIALPPAELKVDYHILHKAAHGVNLKSHILAGHWSMIGGYAGGPEGCGVAAVAASIMMTMVLLPTTVQADVMDTRYLGNVGRDCVWSTSVSRQAINRNSHILELHVINPVSGVLSEALLREVAVGALQCTTSGVAMIIGVRTAGGKFPNHASGVETGFAGEVAKAAAGMTREQANEIANQLLPKYEDDLKRPNIGVSFPEAYNVETVTPNKEWLDMYRKIKREVAALGVPFGRWE